MRGGYREGEGTPSIYHSGDYRGAYTLLRLVCLPAPGFTPYPLYRTAPLTMLDCCNRSVCTWPWLKGLKGPGQQSLPEETEIVTKKDRRTPGL